ncbi:MAG: sensor histidine kinase N-terminal domain-containing protein [Pararobbsia sp.]
MPASSGPAPSLRRSLLRRLAAPFLLLALASGLIAFGLALQYTERVVDRSLSDLATSIAQEVHVSGDRADETVPSLAQAMFSDPVEQLVYRVSDGQVELAGNAELPLEGTEVRRMDRATLFDATFQGNSVRVAQVLAPRVNGRPLIIEVGQRFGRRYRLAAEFPHGHHDAARDPADGGIDHCLARRQPAARAARRAGRFAEPADAHFARAGGRNLCAERNPAAHERRERAARTPESRARRAA